MCYEDCDKEFKDTMSEVTVTPEFDDTKALEA